MAGQIYKTQALKADLLSAPGQQYIGCFRTDKGVEVGFAASNTYKEPHENVDYHICSEVGDAGYAHENDLLMYIRDIKNGADFSSLYRVKATYPAAVELKVKRKDGDLIFFGNNLYAYLSNHSTFAGDFPYTLTCAAVRNGRIFGGDSELKFRLRWSGTADYLDWQEGINGAGYIDLEPPGGKIAGLFDMDEGLVILREFGITVLKTSGAPGDFRIEKPTLILPAYRNKTAQLIMGTLYFCTDGGFYRYKNGKAEKINGLLTNDVSSAKSSSNWQQYYTLCGTSIALRRDVVFVYDTERDTGHYVDVPAYFISKDFTSPLAFAKENTYRLREKYGGYTIECGTFDFGCPDKLKRLTRIDLDSDGYTNVEIYNGITTKYVYGAHDPVRCEFLGKWFRIKIIGNTTMRSATLYAEVRE